jgi:hypothetical protein
LDERSVAGQRPSVSGDYFLNITDHVSLESARHHRWLSSERTINVSWPSSDNSYRG